MGFELAYICMYLAFQVPIGSHAIFVKFPVAVCFCGFSFNRGGGSLWFYFVSKSSNWTFFCELEKEYVYTVYEKSDIKRYKDALLRYKRNNTEELPGPCKAKSILGQSLFEIM